MLNILYGCIKIIFEIKLLQHWKWKVEGCESTSDKNKQQPGERRIDKV